MTSVRSSASQYCRKSLPERSALSPTETNAERPSPCVRARSIAAMPKAPLWDAKPTRPGGGAAGAKVAFSATPGRC